MLARAIDTSPQIIHVFTGCELSPDFAAREPPLANHPGYDRIVKPSSSLGLVSVESRSACSARSARSARAVVPLALIASLAAIALGCGHVGFVNNERPGLSGSPLTAAARRPDDPEADSNGEEPDHPLVETKQERAMVHLHSGANACAGVALGPRVVATSRRCLRQTAGVHSLEKSELRVELASSSLTWTQRAGSHVLVPSCERRDLDVALVVLAEAAPWIEPLGVASAPGVGGTVDALGFDKCEGSKGVKRAQVSYRDAAEIVLDRGLCQGDTGGPVIEAASGNLIGIQGHRKGPRDSPRRETSVTRFDTTPVRELIAQAKDVVDGKDVSQMKPVTCAAH